MFAARGPQPKARLTYILLGILLGIFGVHNFYAGYIKRGLVQLGLTLVTFFYASVVVWIWAVVEVCTVESDNNNINFI
jgi:TM2 domain-containing membrane protein YozV